MKTPHQIRASKRASTWKPWEEALLGKMPDKDVSKLTGRSVVAVEQARKVRQIASGFVRYRNKGFRSVSTALLESTADALSYYEPRPSSEVVNAVLNDFGSVTRRSVIRALGQLEFLGRANWVEEKWIKRRKK